MHRPLLDVARRFGYSKIDRLTQWGNLNPDKAEQILETCVRAETALLFLPGAFFEISPFGSKYGYFGSAHGRPDENYVTFGAELSEKYLRRLFTGIELVIFKLYHIEVMKLAPNCHFEQLKTAQRLNKLKGTLGVKDWDIYKKLYDDLFFVRNAFAHSFVDLDEIEYKGVPLRYSFGDSYLGRSYRNDDPDQDNLFIDNARMFVDTLIVRFTEIQLKQIDADKLTILCDRVLKPRSLTR